MKASSLQYEKTGFLKVGIHRCTWKEFFDLTFTNPHRRELGGKLLNFMRWPISAGKFSSVYIGGGFISNRPDPADIDLVLELRFPFGPEAFIAMEPFFSRGLDKIWNAYSVHLHFWMEGAPQGLADYRSFFQYERRHATNNLDFKSKGMIQLSLAPEELGAGLEQPSEDGLSGVAYDAEFGLESSDASHANPNLEG